MIEVINVDKIALKSVNEKYTGGFKLSTPYKNLKRELKFYLKKQCRNIKLLEPPYRVEIHIKTYMDIDNCIKAILDVLNKNIIKDDRHILELNVYKTPHKRGKMSSLVVLVEGEYEPPIRSYFPVLD